jgi:hypothetical protein
MKFLHLLILISITSFGYAQKKKATQKIQPYSISNIKLGMTTEDFIVNYIDSIPTRDVRNSTETLLFNSLMVNNIEVSEVLVKFYKNRLITLSFITYDSMMHAGLSAKYGYNIK